jgi:hypothetical protein
MLNKEEGRKFFIYDGIACEALKTMDTEKFLALLQKQSINYFGDENVTLILPV